MLTIEQILEEQGLDLLLVAQEAIENGVCDAACLACGYYEEQVLEPDGDGTCPDCYSNEHFASVLIHAGLI